MKKTMMILALVALAPAEQVFYVHPMTLAGVVVPHGIAEFDAASGSAGSSADEYSVNYPERPLWVNLTWEYKFNPVHSLIVDPSWQNWKRQEYSRSEGMFWSDYEGYTENSGYLGSLYVGMRQSKNWKYISLYLQESLVGFHERMEWSHYTDGTFSKRMSSVYFEGYFGLGAVVYGGISTGYKSLRTYLDVGFGGAKTLGVKTYMANVPSVVLLPDVNWTVGWAF